MIATTVFKTLTTLASLMALLALLFAGAADARPTGTAAGPVAARRTSLSGGNHFPLVGRHSCNDTENYGNGTGTLPKPTAPPSMGFLGQQVSSTAAPETQRTETGKPGLGLIGHQVGGGVDY